MTQQTGLTADDIKTLQAPLPLSDHEAREKGTNRDKTKKQYLIYINQEGVIPLLNSIDPNWSWDVLNVHFEARYVSVTGRLTLKGVARDGMGGNSPNGKDSPVDEDTVKGAETDALKRAALRFGVGLYLRSAPTFWIDAELPPWKGAEAAMTEFGAWYKREYGVQGVKSDAKAQQPPLAQNAPERGVGGNAGAPDPKDDSPESTQSGKPTGDDFAKKFPASVKWTRDMLFDATHDYFSERTHFDHHWNKHEAEYAGRTLQEAAALVRAAHWNYDKERATALCEWAKKNLGMNVAAVMQALTDVSTSSVKKFTQWDGGTYADAQEACRAWAQREAEKDIEREGAAAK